MLYRVSLYRQKKTTNSRYDSYLGTVDIMCLKTFSRKLRILPHIIKNHAQVEGGIESTKQERLLVARWNHNQLQAAAQSIFHADRGAAPVVDYVHQSAVDLKEQLSTSPSWVIYVAKVVLSTG